MRKKDFDKPTFEYPYQFDDDREDMDSEKDVLRVLRGGAFHGNQGYVRCAFRYRGFPGGRDYYVGFRVVVSPISHPSAL